MDNELFELCKEVYERTVWDGDIADWGDNKLDKYGQLVPKYTSDYLLEKLPKQYRQYWLRLEPLQFTENHIRWRAYYQEDETLAVGEYANEESPLKALLKLTIALHEAGEL